VLSIEIILFYRFISAFCVQDAASRYGRRCILLSRALFGRVSSLEEVGRAPRPWFEVGLGNPGVSLRMRKPQCSAWPRAEHKFHTMEILSYRFDAMLEVVLLVKGFCKR
jgi:hypothetical protein